MTPSSTSSPVTGLFLWFTHTLAYLLSNEGLLLAIDLHYSPKIYKSQGVRFYICAILFCKVELRAAATLQNLLAYP